MRKASNSPKISVLVPTYNNGKYIKNCIKSIQAQDYENIEIIIIDDGSTDNTRAIIQDMQNDDARIKYYFQHNSGISVARNNAIKKATANYIIFVDSDDEISRNHVGFLYDTLKKYDSDVAISSYQIRYKNKIINKSIDEERTIDRELYHLKTLYGQNYDVTLCSKLYKKKLFDNIEFPNGQLFEDTAITNIVIDQADTIAINSRPIYTYIIRNESITTYSFDERKLDLIKSTDSLTEYLESKYSSLHNACLRRKVYARLSTLSQLANSNDRNMHIEKELRNYVLKNAIKVLFNRNVPKRDKIAVLTLLPGFRFYKIIWSIYKNTTGRSIPQS